MRDPGGGSGAQRFKNLKVGAANGSNSNPLSEKTPKNNRRQNMKNTADAKEKKLDPALRIRGRGGEGQGNHLERLIRKISRSVGRVEPAEPGKEMLSKGLTLQKSKDSR